jgi:hypothetical protein
MSKKILIGMMAALLAGPAMAAKSTSDTQVNMIYVNSSDNTIFVETAEKIVGECSGSFYSVILPTQPLASEIYSALLAAQMSKRNVVINASGCDPNGFPKIAYIQLK